MTFYSIVVCVAHVQIVAKMVPIICNREELTSIIDWFQEFYTLNEIDGKVKAIFKTGLSETLRIVELCLKFPFTAEYQAEVHFVLLLIYQSVCIFFNTFLVVIEDSLFATIGIHFMGLLNILCDLIRLLDDSSEDYSDLLRRIQRLHSDIINHNRIFNNLLFHVLLVQLCSSIFIIFMTFSAIRFNTVDVVSYFLGASGVIQLLLLCLFGELIFMRYKDVEQCLQLTNWYNFSIADQKNYIQIMRMAQKSYGLKAGGMYDISMSTFIEIMKMTISYCAIIFALIE
ncbi:odorant receptor 4-like [Phlebotomus argentipes]|uniref:odorant receptor 4-like n=1 Tax=Phlebotomus argentipes TaxID=94469 RepID=UPI0028934D02|nr:odorant receptor 4-like [Phlebotomus argentipes]